MITDTWELASLQSVVSTNRSFASDVTLNIGAHLLIRASMWFLENVASLLMIFGGVVPYIPQYLEIRNTKNAEGFSTYVCFTLLIANTLRILFWFGHPFELPLLIQSVIMNATMLAMVYICVNVRRKNEIVTINSRRQFTDMNMDHFWQWTDFMSYIHFMLLFSLVMTAVLYLFINNLIFVEFLGLAALLMEAMLGLPQFYRNFQHKSTAGMSIKMVLLWTCGDIFKTVYFVVRSAPTQFWLCGLLQISLDVSILFQVFYYKPSDY